ncbi:hypothetical protein BD779DRAFT_1671015 [Infundibulicybe gibba]|nr:hypothetical protein BD779DRAFT_1671015 [Infundibulicybe gibba]
MPDSMSVEAMTGPLLIGFLLNSCLFGVLTVQIYVYFSSFPKDRIHTKFLVGGVYLVEIAQTILTVCDAYVVFATGFGNVAVLAPVRTVWIYSLVLGPIVAFVVQAFYAHRISVLYQSWKLGSVIVLMSVIQLVTGQVCAALLKLADELKAGPDKGLVFARISIGSTFACDATIVICMTLWLLRARRDNKSSRWAHNITLSLLRVTVENGIILATVNIVAIVFSLSYLYLSPLSSSTATKWYSMTLLVSLNNRPKTQPQMEANFTIPTGIQFQMTTGTQVNVTLLEPPPTTRSIASRYSAQPACINVSPV